MPVNTERITNQQDGISTCSIDKALKDLWHQCMLNLMVDGVSEQEYNEYFAACAFWSV